MVSLPLSSFPPQTDPWSYQMSNQCWGIYYDCLKCEFEIVKNQRNWIIMQWCPHNHSRRVNFLKGEGSRSTKIQRLVLYIFLGHISMRPFLLATSLAKFLTWPFLVALVLWFTFLFVSSTSFNTNCILKNSLTVSPEVQVSRWYLPLTTKNTWN